jgi:glycosyltransferase involved in cell wall biosynthesis
MTRLNVCVFVRYSFPAVLAGGPPRSLHAMFELLWREIDFSVFCLDRDLNQTSSFEGIRPGDWYDHGSWRSKFDTYRSFSFLRILREIRQAKADYVYLNSFFDVKFSTLPLLCCLLLGISQKVVIASRGELSQGALSIKSPKKRLFIFLMRTLGVYRNVTWHASTQLELEEIVRLRLGKREKIVVACDCIILPAVDEAALRMRHRAKGPLKICFLSRISPKKNLLFCMEVLKRTNVDIEFDVYGASDDKAYWEQCLELAKELPKTCRFQHKGVVGRNALGKTLLSYDFFFLPTLGENFGHAIIESLHFGVPVLISDQTPWDDVEKEGCGWAIPLTDIDAYVAAIEQMGLKDSNDREKISSNARRYASKILDPDVQRKVTLELFPNL